MAALLSELTSAATNLSRSSCDSKTGVHRRNRENLMAEEPDIKIRLLDKQLVVQELRDTA